MHKFWIEIRSSLWFVPACLVLAAIAAGLAFVEIDVLFADQLKPLGWMPFLNTGAEGARGMLSSIASSMITVAGVAFSITIVALSLASTQYTPRILRNFMRDGTNQCVLGVFAGIYVYCLIVLRSIRGGSEDGGFVPLIAVFVALLLALVGIGYLIYFIHHIASSIQASYILESIAAETLDAIDRAHPRDSGLSEETVPCAFEPEKLAAWQPVDAHASGYLQAVDCDALVDFASSTDTCLRLHAGLGDFVVKNAPLLHIDRALDDPAAGRLRGAFVIGNFRTVDQDPGFGIRQIVDIALKALSPGVNDTSTAVSCLDYLSVLLTDLARRRITSPYRPAEDEPPRIFASAPLFSEYLARALDEIRLCASGNVTIILAILILLTRVAGATADPARRLLLLIHAGTLTDLADTSVRDPYDRARVNAGLAQLRTALGPRAQIAALSMSGVSDGR